MANQTVTATFTDITAYVTDKWHGKIYVSADKDRYGDTNWLNQLQEYFRNIGFTKDAITNISFSNDHIPHKNNCITLNVNNIFCTEVMYNDIFMPVGMYYVSYQNSSS